MLTVYFFGLVLTLSDEVRLHRLFWEASADSHPTKIEYVWASLPRDKGEEERTNVLQMRPWGPSKIFFLWVS